MTDDIPQLVPPEKPLALSVKQFQVLKAISQGLWVEVRREGRHGVFNYKVRGEIVRGIAGTVHALHKMGLVQPDPVERKVFITPRGLRYI